MIYARPLDVRPPSSGAMLLVKEMAHRVANQFSLAIAEMSLAAARTADAGAKAALERAIARLLDSAEAHRVLQPPWETERADLSAYLQMVCQALVRSMLRDRNIKLTFASESVVLDAERCWRVGLIVSELITNAARHAFDESGGDVRVEVATHQGHVLCRVSDNGATSRASKPGRGSAIVEALAEDVGGWITRTHGVGGMSVVLSLPG